MNLLKNKNFIYLIYLPIFVNYFYNFFQKINSDNLTKINYFDLFSTLILFVFLFSVGYSIKKTLHLRFVSTGIVNYLLSFFIFDLISLFFYRNLKFNEVFLIVNILWIILFLSKKMNVSEYLRIAIPYLFLKFFSYAYFEKFTKNKNIVGDVQDVLLKHVKNIYEHSYFFSMNNPSMEGYPQLTAYVQAIFHRLLKEMTNFEFLAPGSKVIFFLFILLFFELNLNRESKFLASILFATIIFNSEWLKFLFIDSLMTEGVIAYLFSTLLLSITNKNNDNAFGISISFFIFGFLFIAKQFISTISIILIFSFLISKKTRKFVFFGIVGYLIKELSYFTYFKNLVKSHHLKEVNIFDALLDLIFLRDLKFENIIAITKNIFLDKPFFLVLLLFFITLVFYLFKFKANDNELNTVGIVLVLNIALVLALYIGIWKNMELESPVRFFLYMLPLYIYFQIKVIENFVKLKGN